MPNSWFEIRGDLGVSTAGLVITALRSIRATRAAQIERHRELRFFHPNVR